MGNIKVSTGIPIFLVSRAYLANSLSIRWNCPVLALMVFLARLVPEALRKICSFETIFLKDFLSKVCRLNSLFTQRHVADALPLSLNFSIILNFSAMVKRMVIRKGRAATVTCLSNSILTGAFWSSTTTEGTGFAGLIDETGTANADWMAPAGTCFESCRIWSPV